MTHGTMRVTRASKFSWSLSFVREDWSTRYRGAESRRMLHWVDDFTKLEYLRMSMMVREALHLSLISQNLLIRRSLYSACLRVMVSSTVYSGAFVAVGSYVYHSPSSRQRSVVGLEQDIWANGGVRPTPETYHNLLRRARQLRLDTEAWANSTFGTFRAVYFQPKFFRMSALSTTRPTPFPTSHHTFANSAIKVSAVELKLEQLASEAERHARRSSFSQSIQESKRRTERESLPISITVSVSGGGVGRRRTRMKRRGRYSWCHRSGRAYFGKLYCTLFWLMPVNDAQSVRVNVGCWSGREHATDTTFETASPPARRVVYECTLLSCSFLCSFSVKFKVLPFQTLMVTVSLCKGGDANFEASRAGASLSIVRSPRFEFSLPAWSLHEWIKIVVHFHQLSSIMEKYQIRCVFVAATT